FVLFHGPACPLRTFMRGRLLIFKNDDAAPAGLRPDKVTVELLDGGQPVGQSIELSAANGWTGTFTNLPVYREGRKAVYSV
ncbi:Cna B-type domain-containing protein, partial [Streptococcus anginosus]|nr:Cna B-type domain-containing protein [Streptococcus anginosus]